MAKPKTEKTEIVASSATVETPKLTMRAKIEIYERMVETAYARMGLFVAALFAIRANLSDRVPVRFHARIQKNGAKNISNLVEPATATDTAHVWLSTLCGQVGSFVSIAKCYAMLAANEYTSKPDRNGNVKLRQGEGFNRVMRLAGFERTNGVWLMNAELEARVSEYLAGEVWPVDPRERPSAPPKGDREKSWKATFGGVKISEPFASLYSLRSIAKSHGIKFEVEDALEALFIAEDMEVAAKNELLDEAAKNAQRQAA